MYIFNELFNICCDIMSGLGKSFGLSYQEICVIGNIYVQGGIWILSTLFPLTATIKKKSNAMYFASVNTLFSTLVMLYFSFRYAPPLAEAFNKCVADLRAVAVLFHTTYEVVNIVIFIILWLTFVIGNLIVAKRISKW